MRTRLDLLVERMLVIELKTVDPLPPVYFKQVRTHLLLLNLKHGMLVNFKVELMKDGIHRGSIILVRSLCRDCSFFSFSL